MGFWADFQPIFRKTKLTFINKEHEVGNIYSFYFKLDKDVPWKAGQHGIISFPQKMKGRAWRGFSIASAPHEEKIKISTRITQSPSEFKLGLVNLKPGDTVTTRGPFGPFYTTDRKPVVFIAGGIGITPFRSLILDAQKSPGTAPESIHLIYMDQKQEYCYQQDFESISQSTNLLQVDYITREALEEKLSQVTAKLGNNADYFISGSQGMVKAIKENLVGKSIAKSNIKTELFLGL